MKKILVIYYSILYLLGIVSFILNSISLEYSYLGFIVFGAGFIVIWVIGFFSQFINKGFQLYQKHPQSFIKFDVKNKFTKNEQLYIYTSSAIFMSIAVVGWFMLMFYGGGPEIIDGVYVIQSHGHIVKEGISKFEFDVLSFFEVQMFVCLSLIVHSGVIIYMKDTMKTKHPIKKFNEFDWVK
ncbi:MAG: hypothetical protein Q7I99_00915 [Acholeplasmataceae bacterium]|nr:hypothetical protein [Acholeplasmataceae bacterium]